MFELSGACVGERIKNVSVSLEAGQQCHILGANGAGKSSLLNVLAGLVELEQGSIHYQKQAMENLALPVLAANRCFLQQDQASAFDIPLAQLLAFYTQYNELPDALEACLQLGGLLHKPLSVLSGGQQQRFNLARSLLQVWPAIEQGEAAILLDEPCQHLDINYQYNLMHLLCSLTNKGNCVILSSHDINLSMSYADKAILMKDGEILSRGDVNEALSLEHLEKAYSHRFVALELQSNELGDKQIEQEAIMQNMRLVKRSQKYITSAINQAPLA